MVRALSMPLLGFNAMGLSPRDERILKYLFNKYPSISTQVEWHVI